MSFFPVDADTAYIIRRAGDAHRWTPPPPEGAPRCRLCEIPMLQIAAHDVCVLCRKLLASPTP